MKGLVKIGTLFSIAALVGVTAFGAAQPADAHNCRNWEHQRYENWKWRQRAMYNNAAAYNAAAYNNAYYNGYGYRPSLFTRMSNRLF